MVDEDEERKVKEGKDDIDKGWQQEERTVPICIELFGLILSSFQLDCFCTIRLSLKKEFLKIY